MESHLKNSRVFIAKMFGATTYQGVRVKITETRNGVRESVYLPTKFLEVGNSTKDHSIAYLNSIGIEVVAAGWFGNECMLLSNTWETADRLFISLKSEPYTPAQIPTKVTTAIREALKMLGLPKPRNVFSDKRKNGISVKLVGLDLGQQDILAIQSILKGWGFGYVGYTRYTVNRLGLYYYSGTRLNFRKV